MSSNSKIKEKIKFIEYNLAPPADWRITRLSEISNIRFSNVDKKGKRGEYPVKLCNYMDVYANEYITSKLNFMEATASSDEIAKFLVEEGDVIVTKDSETPDDIGIPAAVAEKIPNLVCGYHLAQIKPNAALVNSIFLAKQIGHDRIARHFSRLANGSTRYGLSTASFENVEIWLPPFTEQRKIAKILTTVDNLIEKTEALIAKYEAIKQGMMHDLFTRGVDENGRLRPSYQEAQELYNKTEFGWVPKDWQIKEMSFFLDYISYGFTNPMPEMSEGPWMVTAANIFQGVIQYNTCRHTSKEAFDRLLTKKSRPLPGDILLTKDGTLGRIALVGKDGICINQSVAILRVNEKTTPMFIKLLLESPLYQQRLLHDAGGSTIKHIYITVVDKMPVAIPKSRIEQEKIISHIETIDKKVETERKYHNKMMSIKTALMQDLLTGKVRVPPDEETEAHV